MRHRQEQPCEKIELPGEQKEKWSIDMMVNLFYINFLRDYQGIVNHFVNDLP